MLPRDLAVVVFRCGSCRQHRPLGFVFTHSPYFGEAGAPAYREARELSTLLEELSTRRHPLVSKEDYEAMRDCGCRGPRHRVQPVGAALFHAMIGTGAHLMAGLYHGERELARYPPTGSRRSSARKSIAARFGRPVSLFPAWRAVLSAEPGAHVQAEAGVHLISADAEPGALEGAAQEIAGGRSNLVFEVDAKTVRGAAWPPDLREAGDAVECG